MHGAGIGKARPLGQSYGRVQWARSGPLWGREPLPYCRIGILFVGPSRARA